MAESEFAHSPSELVMRKTMCRLFAVAMLLTGCLEDGVQTVLDEGLRAFRCDNGSACPDGWYCMSVVDNFGNYGGNFCHPPDGGVDREGCEAIGTVQDLCGPGELCYADAGGYRCECGMLTASNASVCGDGVCSQYDGGCSCPPGTQDCGEAGSCGGKTCAFGNRCVAGQCVLDLDYSALCTLGTCEQGPMATDGESLFVVFRVADSFSAQSEIWRVPFSGASPERVVQIAARIVALVAHPEGLMYWSHTQTFANGVTTTTRTITSTDSRGQNGTLAFEESLENVSGDDYWVWSAHIDGSDVYWSGTLADTGQVWTMPLDGSATPVSTGIAELEAVGVFALDATSFYFVASYGQEIKRISREGGAATTLTPQLDHSPAFLAVSDTRVLWTYESEGSVYSVEKVAGGLPTTHNEGADTTVFARPGDMSFAYNATFIVDGTNLYDVWRCTNFEGPSSPGCPQGFWSDNFARLDTSSNSSQVINVATEFSGRMTDHPSHFECFGIGCTDNGGADNRSYPLLADLGAQVLVATGGRLWFFDKTGPWVGITR